MWNSITENTVILHSIFSKLQEIKTLHHLGNQREIMVQSQLNSAITNTSNWTLCAFQFPLWFQLRSHQLSELIILHHGVFENCIKFKLAFSPFPDKEGTWLHHTDCIFSSQSSCINIISNTAKQKKKKEKRVEAKIKGHISETEHAVGSWFWEMIQKHGSSRGVGAAEENEMIINLSPP